jgi:outer membrane biosynthesis protein TonB
MINRVLIPPNATLGADSSATPGTRRKTALDTRTVIAADLPSGQIDAKSNIPAYMPLDVLSARLIIPRDMPVNKLDIGGLPSYVPLAVLGEHVAVPKDAVLPQTIAVRHPMQHAAELPEVLDPDVLTTGEVNLMTGTPRNLRDEAKWVLRGTSAVLHAAALGIILLISSMITPHQPTPDEIIRTSHSLGDVYIPQDLQSTLRPTPPRIDPGSNKIHIDPKVIRQLAPPEPTPAPKSEVPAPVIVHEQPRETPVAPPLPVAPQPQPAKPQPTLEPIRADQPPTPHGLILPNTSIGRTLSQAANDASQPTGGGGASSIVGTGRMPGGRGGGGIGGGGGGGGQAGAGLTRLTDTQGVDFSSYDARVYQSVKRNWYSIMPESALMGDQGIVVLRFRIFKDGTVVSEEPILERSSNKAPLDRAAMGSIRASSPFEPLPGAFTGPYVEYIFAYYYNLEIPRGR